MFFLYVIKALLLFKKFSKKHAIAEVAKMGGNFIFFSLKEDIYLFN